MAKERQVRPHRLGSTHVLTKHEAMARAVHRLHAELLALDIEDEHVLLVMCRMARDLPQLQVVNIRGNDFLQLSVSFDAHVGIRRMTW